MLKPTSRREVVVAALTALVLITACAGSPAATSGVEAELQQGLDAHVVGDYDTAITHYRRVLQLDPNNKFAYYNIGLIDQINNRMPEAEANYRAAIAIDAQYVPALFNLATVRTQVEDLPGAIELYQRVIAIQPDRASAYLNMGLALARLGRTAEAEAALARAIQLDPSLATTPTPSP